MPLKKLDRLLGVQIQQLRTAKGWSQEHLAEVANLHRTYISQLERGLKSPSVRVLYQIATALSVTMSTLLKVVEESLDADE
jgi:transcriptional regulator with XRE-family HTH domain